MADAALYAARTAAPGRHASLLAKARDADPARGADGDLPLLLAAGPVREQGAGDMGIGHKLKAMANAFYGRIAAYDAFGSFPLMRFLPRALPRAAGNADRDVRRR